MYHVAYFFVGGMCDQSSVDQPSLVNRPLTNRPLAKRPRIKLSMLDIGTVTATVQYSVNKKKHSKYLLKHIS